jgi:hypothetical protein
MAEVSVKALVATAMSFSIALAWNGAVSKFIDYNFPDKDEVTQHFLYALSMTFIILIIVVLINKTIRGSGAVSIPINNESHNIVNIN